MGERLIAPVLAADGALRVAAIGKVWSLDANDGSERWLHRIDGYPTSMAMGAGGVVYVGALSFDWAGLYAIGPRGRAVGPRPLRPLRACAASAPVGVLHAGGLPR